MGFRKLSMLTCAAAVVGVGAALYAEGVGPAFTYQGQLKQRGVPVNCEDHRPEGEDERCSFRFTLWDDQDPLGVAKGGPIVKHGEEVTNGLFTVDLNFGPDAFQGDARWLEIAVCRPPVDCTNQDNYSRLLPRQELTPIPYALFALNGSDGPSLWELKLSDIYYNAGNVGIGTSDPRAKLQIGGSIGNVLRDWMENGVIVGKSGESDGGYFGLKDEGFDRQDTVIAWGDNSADALRFIHIGLGGPADDVEAMRISANGNVGIGTSHPDALLHIQADQDVLEYLHLSGFDNDGAGTRPVFKFLRARGSAAVPAIVQDGDTIGSIIASAHDGNQYWNPASIEFKVDGIPGAADMPGRIEFQTAPDGGTGRGIRMTIDSNGNVGIGTAGDSAKLSINAGGSAVRMFNLGTSTGQVQITGPGGDPGIVGFANNGNRRDIRFDDTGIRLLTNNSSSIPGLDSGISITEIGRVGIGAAIPSALLDIEGAGPTTDIHINNTADDGDPTIRFQLSGSTKFSMGVDDSDGDKFKIGTGAPQTNTRMTIDSNGNVGIGTPIPSHKLEVVSGRVDAFRVGNANSWLRVQTGGNSRLGLGDGAGNEAGYILGGHNASGQNVVQIAACNDKGSCPASTTFHQNGNVGIGATTPDEKLHVAGNVKVEGEIATYLDGTKLFSVGDGLFGPYLFLDDKMHIFGAGLINVGPTLSGPNTVSISATEIAEIRLRNAGGDSTIVLDGSGSGRITTGVLAITGADLAEKFPVSEETKPGMVVAIDPNHAGQLHLARGAYNRRVAGVVSGANGLSVGVVLGNLPGHEDAPPIAMSGRVYVWADASTGPIQPGDLLTTSDTPGHAMKVIEFAKSQGAILGKAMTSLEEGKGLVLVLVTLQ